MNTTADKRMTIESYLELPYAVTLTPEAEGGFTAEIKDLPGCITQGETEAEALDNIAEAKELWLETAFDAGERIPLPSQMADYSGRFVVRLPKSLHHQLSEAADRDGVSLNQHIVSLLSMRTGAETHSSKVYHELKRLRQAVVRIERRIDRVSEPNRH